jgi:hypothetical protein
MVAIQNQQTDLLSFISLNYGEITEGNRSYSLSLAQNVSDVETIAGRLKRFYKNNKRVMSLSFTYLPSNSDKTVDGREGRDYIYNLAMNSPLVFVEYKDIPDLPIKSFYGYLSSYQERIIRRDLNTQCIYYDINFTIEEK